MIWWLVGRAFLILACVVLLVPTVDTNRKRHERWEADSQERIGLTLTPRKRPKGGYRVIVFLVGAIVFFALVPS